MRRRGLCFHKWFGVSATHRHPLSFRGTGEVVLGTHCVLAGVLTVCFWHLYCAYRRCWGGDQGWRPRSQRKALTPGGVCLLIEALLGLLEGATHADSRTGRWGQSRRGARPTLALSLTGSGQCPAAKGRGPAYAHKLISSESAGPPAQSGCLHCGPRALSC